MHREAHWSAVKSILKYLKRTKDMFLIYGGGELILEGYSDASFQSDDDDAKFQSGFVFKFNGGMVSWKSSKQDTTADSTTEAEYIAASEAAKEAVTWKPMGLAYIPKGTTVQQLDRALDGDHEINCLGLGLKCSKSRTSRIGIESPVETCTKSRIHWDGHRRSIPCPRPRPGDGRRKDRTRTDPKPKCSRHISPSLYMSWIVARRPPMVTGSLDQELLIRLDLINSSVGHWLKSI
ncbi:UNVERIFIED_CONTAM: Retrovirus-related Pol polyprotein from transposon TNT 1-94 [Sesamum latifolium]|uniref:Retrovirus-related Pol polyprotein from transposon TNT 1-94 n=1 Tax=Sesamum latifolium TaxID=2727402 RepID=A0AAW2XUY7_9LAMI